MLVVALVVVISATIIIFIINQRRRKYTYVNNAALVIVMSATKVHLYKCQENEKLCLCAKGCSCYYNECNNNNINYRVLRIITGTSNWKVCCGLALGMVIKMYTKT